MNNYAFEAERQLDGSYIMSVSGKLYRCTDWEDVCRQYRKHMEGKQKGSDDKNGGIQRDI
ncbi:MAG: hypothetical protein J6P40_08955 [Oscillospiraceae bacterium]|nr:hypothetical protein [Oscillospiraceae bacterium]